MAQFTVWAWLNIFCRIHYLVPSQLQESIPPLTCPKIHPLHPEGIGEKAKGYSVIARMNHFKVFLRGIFLVFSFGFRYSTLLHLPPLRFHCVEGCRGRTQDSCDYGIGSQSSNALTARLDLIHNSPRSHPLSARSHPHLARSQPH
jgi:hypothetical protein